MIRKVIEYSCLMSCVKLIVAVMTFQTSSEGTKRLSTGCSCAMIPKSDFLLIGAGTITPKGTQHILEKI